jgi:hypothetical protein
MNPNEERVAPASLPPSTLSAPVSQSASVSSAERVDLYGGVHRGLRFMLAKLLVEMGQTSFGDFESCEPILAELATVLWACDSHIAHEDRHLRPSLAARAPNAVSTLDHEHEEHARQVAELRALTTALREAPTSDARTSIGHTLYLHFSVFVAETLAHMAYEERVVQPLLDRLFTRQELRMVHEAIIRSSPPQEMIVFLRAMIPAANREGRAELVANVRANAPPEAFAALLKDVRPLVRPDDWADLSRRLEL